MAYNETYAIAALSCFLVAFLCVSLCEVSRDVPPAFHIGYNSNDALHAALSITVFGCFVPLLVWSRFSFGYLVSFYMLAVTAGYFWLSYFTPLEYNHFVGRWSTAASFAAFALPAVLITKPRLKIPTIVIPHMDLLAACLVGASLLIVAYGAHFGFHIVGIMNSETFRTETTNPRWMSYALSVSSTALLPFAYAWFVLRKRYALASLTIFVAIAYYPIMANKTALLTPLWLLALTYLLRIFKPRIVVILSILVPLVLGLLAKAVDPSTPELIFRLINFRMLSISASGLDHYYHFFSMHPLTHFCQISIIGGLLDCALPDQLGVTMAKEYAIGNYNASLFATEGIASVGPYLAPIIAFFCGTVISLGNLTSAELNPSFVLLSSSILAQALMNVPLSTIMLTHGGLVTFCLWLITPREPAN